MSSRLHTFTGTGFDPLNPSAEDVRLEDIAHGLSNMARFNGQAPRFYSVAQHAVLVAGLVLAHTDRPDWALLALHHDSAEAYIGDWPRPIKGGVVFYREVHPVRGEPLVASPIPDGRSYMRTPIAVAEARVYDAVLAGLGILDDQACAEVIRNADDALLIAELRGFFNEPPDKFTGRTPLSCPPIAPHLCQPPHEAEEAFLLMHAAMLKEMGAGA